LKTGREKIDVVFMGRFSRRDILSGPEKTAKRIFEEHTKFYNSCFMQYFFDGSQYTTAKKLFGREKEHEINGSNVLTLGFFAAVKTLVKFKPAIIHIITYERFAIAALTYKLFFGAKIIYNVHGIIAYENYELKKIPFSVKLKDKICEKLFLKYSDKLIFYSEASIDITEKYFVIDETKAVILANGIDTVFHKQKDTVKEKTRGVLKIVLLNTNELHKSSIELLNKCLGSIKIPAELYIIGEAGSVNATDNVKIIKKDILNAFELAEFYNDIDVFLSLNKYETFSISTVEAMAAGLVPIVTEETGMSRYIINGENGFTVKFGDSNKIAEILNHIGSDRDMLEEIPSKASKIYELLSWQNVYDTYRNIYLTLLK
jgi:glycosyltransferase involved in cell wall biosynthesis